MDINTAFYILALLREEFKTDVLKYPCMDGCDEDFDAKIKEVNVQALTVVLKELKRSLTDDFKRAMAKSSLVEDIFKTTGR